MSTYRKEKLKDLFETKSWSDCTFIIDDERIPAHKFLLACSSPVFESMFYGEMASNEIIIEDIENMVFKKSLEYIYTDKLDIESVLEAWSLIYVSQKYFFYELQKLCIEYIKTNLSISNLLMSYEYSKLYSQKILMDKCLDDILTYTRGILLFSNYHMQATTLCAILKENRGNKSDLLMLAISWGLEECSLQDTIPSKENIYSVLKKSGITNDLRFKDFNFFYNKHMLKPLTKDQICLLENVLHLSQQFYMDHINFAPSLCANLKFSKTNQFVFRTEYKNSIGLTIIHRELLSPTVVCNRNCLIFGVAVTTKSRPANATCNDYSGGANIYIYLKGDNNISHLIYVHEKQCNYLEYNDMQRINFSVPVLFEAYKRYMICVEYNSENLIGESVLLKYMSDTLSKHKNDSTVIEIMDEGNGSVLKGICFYEA